eukprot:3625697-Amphidinium_carterae.1
MFVGLAKKLRVSDSLCWEPGVWSRATVGSLRKCRACRPPAIFEGFQNLSMVVLVGILIASSTLILALAFTRDPDSTGPIAAMLPLNGLMVQTRSTQRRCLEKKIAFLLFSVDSSGMEQMLHMTIYSLGQSVQDSTGCKQGVCARMADPWRGPWCAARGTALRSF